MQQLDPPNHPDPPTSSEIAASLLAEHGGAIVALLRGADLPEAFDAAQDTVGALSDLLAPGAQLEADLADLERRRDLLRPTGTSGFSAMPARRPGV